MSDATQLLPNREGIPSDLKYDLKPSGVRARNYRASVLPTNKSTFNPSDLCVLYIPGGRRNTYLDTTQTYIRYTIKNTDTTASSATQLNNNFYLDNNGACVINRLDVFHSSNLLETVQQYNVLMTAILDANANSTQRLGMSSAYGTAPSIGTPVSSNANLPASSVDISRQGALLRGREYVSTTDTGYNQQITICMPVLSGVFGLGSDKMLPIGKLNDDIRVEITFETLANAMVFTNALSSGALPSTAGWSITDVQLELSITEVSDDGEAMINSMISPEHPIYLHHNSWRSYVSTLPATSSGGYSTLVPARFGSLKSLIVCPRSAVFNTPGQYTLSSRSNPNFSQYNWRFGSNLYPSKPVVLENATSTGGYAEAFFELQKMMHSLSSVQNATSLPFAIYNVADTAGSAGTGYGLSGSVAYSPVSLIKTTVATGNSTNALTAGNTYQNGFLIGQELESFALRSDVLLSGLNTLSQQVFFEPQINVAVGSSAYTLNFYANYDGIIVLDNGIMSVRF
jgi:hypothetical protein